MDLFIYSDESGVFDKIHNDIYVFGGLLFLSKEQKEICSRKYSAAEKRIRASENIQYSQEIKASTISNKSKNKLYRSLNAEQKFAVIINQKSILDQIFKSKKDKQRYLDYAYKISIKRKFENLISNGFINPQEVKCIRFFIDEHTTATNGRYELKELLEQEFKRGTYNRDYGKYFPPIFPDLNCVNLEFCNSASKTLVRAADIVANKVYHMAIEGNDFTSLNNNNLYVTKLP